MLGPKASQGLRTANAARTERILPEWLSRERFALSREDATPASRGRSELGPGVPRTWAYGERDDSGGGSGSLEATLWADGVRSSGTAGPIHPAAIDCASEAWNHASFLE